MSNFKVLFSFVGEDDISFIEIKRFEYKNDADKSKYVSWFMIRKDEIKKLKFVSMNGKDRFFEEGVLTMDGNDKFFILNESKITLQEENIDTNKVESCIEIWDK